jgi:hypothetical protein
MKPVLYTGNLVERGTLESSGAVIGKPVTRVADGDIGLPWADTSAAAGRYLDLKLSTPMTANAWAVASGHNLAGVPCHLRFGPVGGPYTLASSVTPASSAAFRAGFPPATAMEWWIDITTPNQPPSLMEWVVSNSLILPSGPQEPSLVTGPLGNIQSYDSPAGYTWTRKKGPPRWEGTYLIRDLTLAQRGDLEAAFSATDEGVRPFFLEDADGVLRWVYWLTDGGKLAFQAEGITRWRVTLQFREGL